MPTKKKMPSVSTSFDVPVTTFLMTSPSTSSRPLISSRVEFHTKSIFGLRNAVAAATSLQSRCPSSCSTITVTFDAKPVR